MWNDSPPRILLAEDDADFRVTLEDWLRAKGFAVRAAGDGLQALGLIEQEAFEVLITDLKMPNCNGLQLLSAAKARDPHIEVIFLTGNATVEVAVEALHEGRSFDFLQKPLGNFRTLEKVIRRALEHRSQKLANQSPPQEVKAAPLSELMLASADKVVDHPSLLEALRFIRLQFRAPIGLSEVASAIGLSPSYLTNLMRRVTGKTVQQWIIDLRMAQACHLLLSTDWTVQRIAEESGYPNPNHFHRQFRMMHEVSPQTWRMRQTGAGAEGDPSR